MISRSKLNIFFSDLSFSNKRKKDIPNAIEQAIHGTTSELHATQLEPGEFACAESYSKKHIAMGSRFGNVYLSWDKRDVPGMAYADLQVSAPPELAEFGLVSAKDMSEKDFEDHIFAYINTGMRSAGRV